MTDEEKKINPPSEDGEQPKKPKDKKDENVENDIIIEVDSNNQDTSKINSPASEDTKHLPSPENISEKSTEEEPIEAVFIEEVDDTGIESDILEISPAENLYSVDEEKEELRENLRKKTREAENNFNRLLRLQAEFENFKKRTFKEKQEFKKYCLESIMMEIIPNIDNLERGIDSARKTENIESIIEGIKMIHRNLLNSLTKFGLKTIDTKNQIFDPNKHEAMMTVDSSTHKNNMIIEELQKGYVLHDRVIRPSLVSVAKYVVTVDEDDIEPDEQIKEALREITSKFKLEDFNFDEQNSEDTTSDDDTKKNNDTNNI